MRMDDDGAVEGGSEGDGFALDNFQSVAFSLTGPLTRGRHGEEFTKSVPVQSNGVNLTQLQSSESLPEKGVSSQGRGGDGSRGQGRQLRPLHHILAGGSIQGREHLEDGVRWQVPLHL